MKALTPSEIRQFSRLLLANDARACAQSLKRFVHGAWRVLEPSTPLQWNWHLDTLCAYLTAFRDRRIRRIILNVPPGTMKSLLMSVMYPAWVWTTDPGHRTIGMSNEDKLATRDNLKMRTLVQSEWYRERWGDRVAVSSSQGEKTHFANTAHGFLMSLGIKASVTGKRGNTLLIDDPLDAMRAFSEVEAKAVNVAYDQAVNTRLNQPNEDGIAIIMQRLRTNDLSGHVLAKKKSNWVHVCIPMRYEGKPSFDPVRDLGPEYAGVADPRSVRGELLWPERFNADTMAAMEEDLGEYGTAGQLQQRPAPLSGGIIKKSWWRRWGEHKGTEKLDMPVMKHVFASWDTAFSESDLRNNAFSACTWWGIFWDDVERRDAMMLLGRWYDQAGYPALRAKALGLHKQIGSDLTHLVERKASGHSLIQDLRRNRRLRVVGYDPKNDGDKVARAYLSSTAFKAGQVYVPNRQWATEVIDLVGDFPTGSPLSKDVTDTVTQAVQYLRRGWYLHHPDDDRDASDLDSTPDEAVHEGVYG